MDYQSKLSINTSSLIPTLTNDATPPLAPTDSSMPSSGPTKKFLGVWEHFTKIEGCDSNTFQAKFNHCDKIYRYHHRKHNTSHLKVYLEL